MEYFFLSLSLFKNSKNSIFVIIINKGNKQRHRERDLVDREMNQQKSPENVFYASSKITPVNPEALDNHDHNQRQKQDQHKLPPKAFKPTFQAPQTRSDVSIVSNESNFDFFSLPSSQNNLILSEDSKNIINSHKPVKVHVAHKPTSEDVARVYNPYPLQDEYEQYSKNGFLFENIQSTNKTHIHKKIRADVVFTSESISPYTRKEAHSLVYKNPVTDKVADLARGYDSSMTEFQNLNNLKNTSGYNPKPASSKLSFHTNSDGVGNSSVENIVDVTAQRIVTSFYEDEYDIANKMQKKKGANENSNLINSINSELKRMKSGYPSHQQENK